MQLTHFEAGNQLPLFLIAGPCVVETEALAVDTAGQLKAMTEALGIPFIFKSSFDKANRSSLQSPRGPGLEEGLRNAWDIICEHNEHPDNEEGFRAKYEKRVPEWDPYEHP